MSRPDRSTLLFVTAGALIGLGIGATLANHLFAYFVCTLVSVPNHFGACLYDMRTYGPLFLWPGICAIAALCIGAGVRAMRKVG